MYQGKEDNLKESEKGKEDWGRPLVDPLAILNDVKVVDSALIPETVLLSRVEPYIAYLHGHNS